MEEFAKSLAQYGIVGVVAAMAVYGYLQERRKNDTLRDRIESNAKEHGKWVTDLADRFAVVAKGMQEGGAQLSRQIEETHREQEDELTDRLLKAVETHAENNGRMAEKVALLIDSVRRKGE